MQGTYPGFFLGDAQNPIFPFYRRFLQFFPDLTIKNFPEGVLKPPLAPP